MNNLVYKATHKPTGLIYVGKTIHTLNWRKNHHWYDATRTDINQSKFHQFLVDTCDEEWNWEILETVPKFADLVGREKYWIAKLDAENPAIGLNDHQGGFQWGKSVICLETGEIFPSISEAARFYHVDRHRITKNIEGNLLFCGFHPETNEELHWNWANTAED